MKEGEGVFIERGEVESRVEQYFARSGSYMFWASVDALNKPSCL